MLSFFLLVTSPMPFTLSSHFEQDLITFQIVLATGKEEDTYGLLIYEDDLILNNDQLSQIGLHAGMTIM